MRKDSATESHRVGSLNELDALVGTYLTGETPQTHWEDSNTHFQFSTVEEALEALHDPFFRQFTPEEEAKPTVFTQVKPYCRYSSDLAVAWRAVEQLSANGEPLQVHRDASRWVAAFGKSPAVTGPSAPVAICLAALRARGIDVEVDRDLATALAAEDKNVAPAE
jgi:hypothetical protein